MIRTLLFLLLVAVVSGFDIDILSYNDVYELEARKLGGPSRVIPFVKKMRYDNPNSLVVFAGDTMSPSLWSNEFRGIQMISAHHELTLDFASLGNHEFDFGLEGFYNVSRVSNFPWLNANCFELKTQKLLQYTQPNAVRYFKSGQETIKVGLFGVMYDMKDSSHGVYWTDPIESAKEQVRILREERQVDLVIALTHQFQADDELFVHQVEGVDLVLGGHDHTVMSNFEDESALSPYLKATMDFKNIWRTTLSKSSVNKVVRKTFENINITLSLPGDDAMEHIIDSYRSLVGLKNSVVVGSVCSSLDLRSSIVRSESTEIAHLFADAIMFNSYHGEHKPDVAFMNGGGIRTDQIWNAGNLTRGDVLSWSPFGNLVVTASMTGKTFREAIEFEMSESCGEGAYQLTNGHFVHPSGFTYTFKCQGKMKGQVMSLDWKDNSPIEDSQEIVVAFSDYMFNRMKQNCPEMELRIGMNEAMRMDSILLDVFEKAGGQPVCPPTEIRATVMM